MDNSDLPQPPGVVPPFDPADPVSSLVAIAKGQRLNPSLPSVLCLTRDQIHSDMYAMKMAGFSTRYNWLEIVFTDLEEAQSPWVAPELRVQPYDQSSATEHVWARCAEFAEPLVRRMRDEAGIVAVMSANFDYWVDEGIRRACMALGVPFLVLLREVMLEEANFAGYYGPTFNFRPDVTAVAIAGDETRKFFLSRNLLPADTTVTTGLPRFDWWIKGHPPLFPRPPILLFTFATGYEAGQSFSNTFKEFMRAARRNPDTSAAFVVKCKGMGDQRQMKHLHATHFADCNVKFTAATLMPAVVANARGVIGFNSMAVVEALLSPLPIFYPYWGDAVTGNVLFFPDEPLAGRQITFLRSPAEFAEVLDKLASSSAPLLPPAFDMAERRELAGRYVDFDPDVPATRKVEDFVDRFAS